MTVLNPIPDQFDLQLCIYNIIGDPIFKGIAKHPSWFLTCAS